MSDRRVDSVRAADVHRKRIDWLVAGRIPMGYLTLLAGVQGLGKSQYLTFLAAAHSRGELRGEPGVTLMCSAEDAWDTTVRPRLEACNANLDLVRFIEVSSSDGEGDGLQLPDDVIELAREIQDTGATLVTVDPVLAHLGRDVDSHKDASSRQALAPLARIADKLTCAIVGAHHLNKSASTDPLNRASASMAFTAQPRSVLLFADDPDDPEGERGSQRALAHVKCNVAALAPTQTWRIEPILLPATASNPEVETSRVQLTGETTHTGRELLAAAGMRGEDQEASSALTEAMQFLREELCGGPQLATQVSRAARDYGVSDKTLQRAAKELGVTKNKSGFGAEGRWRWSLELELAKDGQDGWPPKEATDVGHLRENRHQHTVSGGLVHPLFAIDAHVSHVATYASEDDARSAYLQAIAPTAGELAELGEL